MISTEIVRDYGHACGKTNVIKVQVPSAKKQPGHSSSHGTFGNDRMENQVVDVSITLHKSHPFYSKIPSDIDILFHPFLAPV